MYLKYITNIKQPPGKINELMKMTAKNKTS